jgi:hypothetical protein
VFQHPVLGNFAASLNPQAGEVRTEKLNALEALLDEMEEV